MLRWVVAECRHSTLEPGYSGVGVVCFVGTGKKKEQQERYPSKGWGKLGSTRDEAKEENQF